MFVAPTPPLVAMSDTELPEFIRILEQCPPQVAAHVVRQEQYIKNLLDQIRTMNEQTARNDQRLEWAINSSDTSVIALSEKLANARLRTARIKAQARRDRDENNRLRREVQLARSQRDRILAYARRLRASNEIA